MKTNIFTRPTLLRWLPAMAASALVGGMLTSCANTGSGPGGGPRDSTAPKFMGSTPKPMALNNTSQKMVLKFDEYITLRDPYSKFMVSPPQKVQPTITSLGKKVTVELQDSLLPDRTYILDFADAIVDNTEGNACQNFFMTFSTGDHIDSMAIGGQVIDARTLAPGKGIYVGGFLASEPDTAFATRMLDYVAKTDNEGRFILHGLKRAKYRIYALGDKDGNYKYDGYGEDVATLDSLVEAGLEKVEKRDTVYRDSVTIDTIIVTTSYRPTTNNLVLKTFNVPRPVQMFRKGERTTNEKITLYFANNRQNEPKIKLLQPTPATGTDERGKGTGSGNWSLMEKSQSGDTLALWLNDTALQKADTVRMALTYEKLDTLDNYVEQTDTLALAAPQQRKMKKREKAQYEKQQAPSFSLTRSLGIDDKQAIVWQKPLAKFDKSMMRLEMKKDTLWVGQDFELEQDKDNIRRYVIEARLLPDSAYRVTVDSGVAVDIVGRANLRDLSATFRQKPETDYTQLKLTIKGATTRAYAELINANDEAVKKVPVEGDGTATFGHILPGTYYVRLFEDADGNGEWTNGDYFAKRRPENMYYNRTAFSLRANWEREDTWDITQLPPEEQRPAGVKTLEKKKGTDR